ncbi:MAG: methyl-accepting chemotaxis protein [Intestinimonas sp.]|jgi:methyl-accepting chemotaxis protein|nr:methyl-accepting chemotaxis protein [Intestinimonas sp.]
MFRKEIEKGGVKKTRRKKLLTKMLLSIGSAVILVCCITIAVILSNVKHSVNDLNRQNLAANSQAAAYQISNYFSKYVEIAKQMAANSQFENLLLKTAPGTRISDIEGFSEVNRTLLNVQKTDPDNISTAWVADVDSSQFAQSDGYVSDSNWVITNRSWFQQLAKEQKTVITEPYVDTVTKKTIVSVVAPVYQTETHTLLGATCIDFSLDNLYQMISQYTLGETGFYMLTTSAGQLIYHPDKELQGKNISEVDLSPSIISAITNKEAGPVTYTGMGQTNYGYVSTIENTGWVVATGLPESEFNSTYNSLLKTVSVIVLIALLAMALVIAAVSKSMVNPLQKLERVARRIADGDLDMEVDVKSTDEIGQVAVAVSSTVDRLKEYKNYIAEITSVLDQIAVGNLVFDLHCDYAGEFSKIKTSLENIRHTLSNTFFQIEAAADQVASGSGQVSTASQTLAQGATEQAGTIQELSTAMNEIAEKVKVTAQNASNASQLAHTSSTEVEAGNQHMQHMTSAMQDITTSANEINKIIKTIEDIAFQTNILALNAAVEAARAGSAGKGFAVVADEVRNLANKSTEAVESTAGLIQSSIQSVQNGTKIVQVTAQSLNAIMDSTKKTTELIEEISEASNDQAHAIERITQGVDRITSVVQTNSATSEESAASSEELSAQAKQLKTLVGNFKISHSDTKKDWNLSEHGGLNQYTQEAVSDQQEALEDSQKVGAGTASHPIP